MSPKPTRKLRIHKDVLKQLTGDELDGARGGAGNQNQKMAKNSRAPDSCNGVPVCPVKT